MAEVQLETEVQDAQEVNKEEQARFSDYGFCESVMADIEAAGFEHPTPVQAGCMSIALEGRDLIGLAQTGTGKTAAFVLPIAHRLAQRMELAALVLVPTRELANQVTGVFNELGRSSGMRVATIVGGIPMDKDYKALRSWPNVLVATPGRLIDHLTYGSISLKEIEVLVVDEADRMHDMGFIPQIRRILSHMPENRQTMMFTATMPADVEKIARMSMKEPERIQIGLRSAPAEGAHQQLFSLAEEEKTPLLMKLLKDDDDEGRTLVFVRTKRGVDKLHRVVIKRFNAARIHGDREQADRDEAMKGFREGKYRILIATDIAARGLDISGIEHVINYDFPLSAEDYVHRIGRTARQQATGTATSFVTPNDRRFVVEVRKLLGDKLPLSEDLEQMVGRDGKRRSGRGGSRGEAGGPRGDGGDRRGGRSRRGGRRDSRSEGGQTSEVRVEDRGPSRADNGEGSGNVASETAGERPRRRRRSRGRGRSKGGPGQAAAAAGSDTAGN